MRGLSFSCCMVSPFGLQRQRNRWCCPGHPFLIIFGDVYGFGQDKDGRFGPVWCTCCRYRGNMWQHAQALEQEKIIRDVASWWRPIRSRTPWCHASSILFSLWNLPTSVVRYGGHWGTAEIDSNAFLDVQRGSLCFVWPFLVDKGWRCQMSWSLALLRLWSSSTGSSLRGALRALEALATWRVRSN